MRVSVGPWVRQQFRARVGLTALEQDLEAADARILELEEERDAALADAVELAARISKLSGRLGTAEDNARRAAALVEQLMEPGSVEGCTKIRLRDEAEALAFAERLSEDMGGYASRAYECRTCPRHPVTLHRFWHIASATKGLSGERGRIARARDRGRAMLTGPEGLRHYALKAALTDRLDPAG